MNINLSEDDILEGEEWINIDITSTNLLEVEIGMTFNSTTVGIMDTDGALSDCHLSSQNINGNILFAAGEVQFASHSFTAVEGTVGRICASLTATTPSTTELGKTLIVYISPHILG